MYILMTALKNIARYKSRYIIFGIILLAITAFIFVFCSMYVYVGESSNGLIKEFGTLLYIKRGNGELTHSDAANISELPQVDKCINPRRWNSFLTDTITIDDKEFDKSYTSKEEYESFHERYRYNIPLYWMYISDESMDYMSDCPPVYMMGYDMTLITDSAITDSWTLIEGREPKTENEVILNQKYIEIFNPPDVSVGSKLKIDTSIEYTIVGIYDDASFIVRDNTAIGRRSIFCAFISTKEGVERLNTHETSNYGYDYYIYLHSPDDYNSFVQDVKALLNGYTEVHLVYGNADYLINSFKVTQNLSKLCMIAAFAVGAIVIVIMAAVTMSERRYEIGVLLSIGTRKAKIIMIFCTELLIFTAAVAAAGLLIGMTAISPVAAQIANNIEVTGISAASIGLLFASALGIAVFASAFCSVVIMCYSPMSILRSRN